MLKNAIGRLQSARKNINNDKEMRKKHPDKKSSFDIDKTIYNVKQSYLDICQVIPELNIRECVPSSIKIFASMSALYETSFKEIEDEDTCLKFLDTILTAAENIDDSVYGRVYGNYYYDYNFYNQLLGCNYISKCMAETIGSKFKVGNARSIKVLDVNCASDFHAYRVLHIFDNISNNNVASTVDTYIVDTENLVFHRNERFTRSIVGELKGSTISNNVFDVVVLNPPVSYEKEEKKMMMQKDEREYLMKATSYVRPGGYIVYSIPAFKMHREIASYIARTFEAIEIINDEDKPNPNLSERENWDNCYGSCITIVGRKRIEALREVDKDIYLILRNLNRIRDKLDSIETFNETVKSLPLPSTELTVAKFRGAELDDEEMNYMFQTSPAAKEFWNKQKVEKLSDHKKHPLLPLSVGQLGIVTTSGCVNGVIDEGNGYYHALKGRIVRHVDSSSEVDSQSGIVNVVETTSSRVELSMLLPNGDYKVLI